MHHWNWQRVVRYVGYALGLLLVIFMTHTSYISTVLATKQLPIFTWGFFHYELNAKYFQELRYTDLYACALEADKEGNRLYYPDVKMRDLHTYQEVRSSEYTRCPRERFTDARWREFVEDTIELWHEPTWIFRSVFSGNPRLYWNSITFDKGYNAPPTLVALSRLTLLLTAGLGSWQRAVITLIDIASLLIAAWAAIRVFGKQAVYWSAITLFLVWGMREVIFGSFLQMIWFSALVGMLVAVRNEKWYWAGFWLAFATMTRVFPVLFAIPFVVVWARALFMKQETTRRDMERALVAFALSCVGFGAIGLLSGLGLQGWWLFFEKMAAHAHYLAAEYFNLGWNNLIASLLMPQSAELPRLAAFEPWLWPARAAAAVYLLMILWRARFASLERLILCVIPLVFFAVVLSPYYYAFFAFIPLLLLNDKGKVAHRRDQAALVLLVLLLLIHLVCIEGGLMAAMSEGAQNLFTQAIHALFCGAFAWIVSSRDTVKPVS